MLWRQIAYLVNKCKQTVVKIRSIQGGFFF